MVFVFVFVCQKLNEVNLSGVLVLVRELGRLAPFYQLLICSCLLDAHNPSVDCTPALEAYVACMCVAHCPYI